MIFKIKNNNNLLTFKFNNQKKSQNFHLISIRKYKRYKKSQKNHQIKLEIIIQISNLLMINHCHLDQKFIKNKIKIKLKMINIIFKLIIKKNINNKYNKI